MPIARRVSPDAMRASGLPPLPGAERRGDELGGRERAHEARRRLGVLRRERLRRRDQHALVTGLRGAHQAVQGDDRLAGAHVALQQAAHRLRLSEIRLELVERRQLVRRQLEREPVEERVRELAGRRQRRRLGAGLLLPLVQQQADLHEQEFLEHQPLARRARLTERARQVHRGDRVRPTRQTLAHEEVRRQRVGEPAHHRRELMHQGPQQLRRDLLAGGVHRDHALGVHALPLLLLEDLVPLDHELLPPALRPEGAAQTQPHPLGEHPREVLLVEPHGVHGAGVVAHEHLDDVHPPARRALGAHADHLAADGRLLPDLEVADGLAVAEVLVAAREVLDEVADGLQAERLETAGDLRRHALEVRQRALEGRGVVGEAGERRSSVVPTAAESERKSLPGHSTIIA